MLNTQHIHDVRLTKQVLHTWTKGGAMEPVGHVVGLSIKPQPVQQQKHILSVDLIIMKPKPPCISTYASGIVDSVASLLPCGETQEGNTKPPTATKTYDRSEDFVAIHS